MKETNLEVAFYVNSALGAMKRARTWEERRKVLQELGENMYKRGQNNVKQELRTMLDVPSQEELDNHR